MVWPSDLIIKSIRLSPRPALDPVGVVRKYIRAHSWATAWERAVIRERFVSLYDALFSIYLVFLLYSEILRDVICTLVGEMKILDSLWCMFDTVRHYQLLQIADGNAPKPYRHKCTKL